MVSAKGPLIFERYHQPLYCIVPRQYMILMPKDYIMLYTLYFLVTMTHMQLSLSSPSAKIV